jgi:hypothetical protein
MKIEMIQSLCYGSLWFVMQSLETRKKFEMQEKMEESAQQWQVLEQVLRNRIAEVRTTTSVEHPEQMQVDKPVGARSHSTPVHSSASSASRDKPLLDDRAPAAATRSSSGRDKPPLDERAAATVDRSSARHDKSHFDERVSATVSKTGHDEKKLQGTEGPIRKKVKVDHDYVDSEQVHKSRTLFLGDSLIKGIVEVGGLQYTALSEGWEVNMRRGAKIRDLEDRLQAMRERNFDRVFVSGGSNNLDRGDSPAKVCAALDQLVRLIHHEMPSCHVHILIPPPRRGVDERVRQQLERALCDLVQDSPSTSLTSMHAAYTGRFDTFVSKCLMPDQVHPTPQTLIKWLQEVTRSFRGQPLKTMKDFPVEMYWGNKCFCCGRSGHIKRDCGMKLVGCDDCGRYGHTTEACLAGQQHALMCKQCGARGHAKAACPCVSWNTI